MSNLFDDVAGKFAGHIDDAIRNGQYVRGDLFVQLAKSEITPGAYVLDYGCGPGRLSCLLASEGLNVCGVDTSEGMIHQAESFSNGQGLKTEFKVIARYDEALTPKTFDAIVCSSVIEYVRDPDELLQSFRQSLRGRGVLLISYANGVSYFRKRWAKEAGENPMGPRQHHVWDWQGFRALLAKNGFQTTTQPMFYESPWDNRPWGKWSRSWPAIGSLGVLAARASAA